MNAREDGWERESGRLGFGRDEEVLIYLCFRSNGLDSFVVHPTTGIYRAA